MKITLYSTGCPNCLRLKELLEKKNIEFNIFTDEEKMLEMGFKKVPMLKVENEEIMDFKNAMRWVNGV